MKGWDLAEELRKMGYKVILYILALHQFQVVLIQICLQDFSQNVWVLLEI
jgi:hypothetical protein